MGRGDLIYGVATAASGDAGIGRVAADPLALAGRVPARRTVGVAPYLRARGTITATLVRLLKLRLILLILRIRLPLRVLLVFVHIINYHS